ncbi:MAG: hypothetical protein HY396_00625 [Candidatus Doudnabacteria bacterium]|nr:hypothetical protein [Candidatus Doudnabacteria bacterium]
MGKVANYFIASAENNYRPPALSYKAFIIYGLILLILRLLLGTISAQGSAVESDVLMSLINQERSQRNVGELITHSSLLTAATQKSQDMIDRDYFAHIDPDGNYVWPKIVAAGYTPYRILGENLAVDFPTSEGMVKAWIDSPTHRANLLHPDFVDQGLVALYGDYKSRYTNLTTSLFGTLAQIIQPKPEVKSEPPVAYLPPPSPEPAPTPKPEITPPPATATSTITASATPTISTTAPAGPASDITQEAPVSAPPIKAYPSPFQISRVIFTLFGILLLIILSADSVILYRHEAVIARSHPSYHFFGFMLIVLVSILIWWW